MFNTFVKSFFLVGRYRKYIPLIIFLFILISFLDIIGLGLIGSYIAVFLDLNEITQNKFSKLFFLLPNVKPIFLLGLAIIFLFFIKTFLGIISNFLIIRFSTSQMNDLRLKLLNIYQRQDYLLHKEKKTSDYIYNIVNLTAEFSNVVQSFLRIFSETILLVLVLFFLAFQDLNTLIVLLLIIVTIIFFYDFFFKKKLENFGIEINKNNNLAINAIIEAMNGLKQIEILNKKFFFFNKTKSFLIKMYKAKEKATIIQLSPRYMMEFVLVLFVVLMSFIAYFNNSENFNLIPNLVVFAFAAIRLLPSSSVMLSSVASLRNYIHSVDILYNDLIQYEQNNKTNNFHQNYPKEKNDLIFGEQFENIILKKVSFSYKKNNQKIFENLNFEINRGDMIGIEGSSGSGKSTLLDLILGFTKPNDGIILLNNKYNFEKREKFIKDKSHYLPQHPFLINGTVKENILLGINEDKNTLSNIKNAIEKACLSDLINNLENGLNTNIGESGSKLSDGQRQRIGIARSIFYDRDILVLDECTNALDNETENKILQYFSSLKKNKTIIFVSHKSLNLSLCDKVYRIENNKIVRI